MSAASYVPEAGDIVWLDFSPQSGHEQAGRRPAVVLSPSAYNRFGWMLCCPLTTKVKAYPFEGPVAGNRGGVVLADQVKSLDWKARNAQRKGVVSGAELREIRAKAVALIGKP
ncbi:endoribonuclease MazF [Aliirhizobium smilacinae]|uniref:Endoribonuclease MazF n=1 Tax=Aliirhizobium smilacinae TaxID=1395944 RepID=A0A5C4XJ53_9HYPH|nr:endoribonuclease MazF [Rhizobium smilacinae]TNM62614.1 endoribonuclease MazF [Rhizobium smilacinae]